LFESIAVRRGAIFTKFGRAPTILRISFQSKPKPVGEICKLNQGISELHGIGIAAIKKFRSGVHPDLQLNRF